MQGLGFKAEGLLEEEDKKKEDAESGPEDEEVPTRGYDPSLFLAFPEGRILVYS